MIVDVRTYTMVPGRLGAWLKLYEAEGMPIHVQHLGKPIGVFTTDVGTVNQVVFFWGFESPADRERRREALEADPDWISYRRRARMRATCSTRSARLSSRPVSPRCKTALRRRAPQPLRASSTMPRNFLTLSLPA